MYTHQIKALHAPMIIGLRGLNGALPLSLTIDTPYQVVGGKPKFTLVGAQPGATIFWSSYKDNKATGEFNASYGQVVEANGTVELEGGAWVAGDVGRWMKEVLIQSSDGTNNRAMVQFVVEEPAPAGGTTPPPSSSVADFLKQGFQLGGVTIPYWIPIGLGAYFVFKKK